MLAVNDPPARCPRQQQAQQQQPIGVRSSSTTSGDVNIINGRSKDKGRSRSRGVGRVDEERERGEGATGALTSEGRVPRVLRLRALIAPRFASRQAPRIQASLRAPPPLPASLLPLPPSLALVQSKLSRFLVELR